MNTSFDNPFFNYLAEYAHVDVTCAQYMQEFHNAMMSMTNCFIDSIDDRCTDKSNKQSYLAWFTKYMTDTYSESFNVSKLSVTYPDLLDPTDIAYDHFRNRHAANLRKDIEHLLNHLNHVQGELCALLPELKLPVSSWTIIVGNAMSNRKK